MNKKNINLINYTF